LPDAGDIVFHDTFETGLGWTVTGGVNTASTGNWERGDPELTFNAGVPLQLDHCQDSTHCLITGLVGRSNDSNDVDGGIASIQSAPLALPAGRAITLTFGFYFAHNTNATSADLFRVRVVGENGVARTVWARAGAPRNVPGQWTTRTANLDAWAGQTVQLRIEAIDAANGSIIEAGVDNVAITAH
jgi:hypothetical protein